ncbi:MAG: peptidyl-prolyl cis-trans isomerase [Brevibacillus sp.]|nr:peptidyl-prolyl cis-trans isomerase [Brevibacillus sp.]
MTNPRVLWGVIGALLLLLSVVGWSWYKQQSAFHTVAVVGEKTIKETDWVAELKKKHGRQVLADMIHREVVFQEAERLGIAVDPQRIEQELDAMKANFGGEQAFHKTLKDEIGTSVEELREQIRYHLLLQEVATKDIVIEEEELRSYYSTHREEFSRPAQAHIWQIVVATREEAEQVGQELRDGANFNTLAKERSIDMLTAASGGDLGWVPLNSGLLSESVAHVASTIELNKDSEPLPVDQGFSIIRVIDRKEAVELSFEQAREQIRQQIALTQVSLDDVLERLKQSVGVTITEQTFD